MSLGQGERLGKGKRRRAATLRVYCGERGEGLFV